jgi:Ca2+-transporting ATPase
MLLLAFMYDLTSFTDPTLALEEARATLFLIFVFFELVVALNCRSLTHSIFKSKPHKSLWLAVLSSALLTLAVLFLPSMREAFGVAMPTPSDIALATGLSLLPLTLLEILKLTLIKRVAKPK